MNFRKVPGRVISKFDVDNEERLSPQSILEEIYTETFGGRSSGWYQIFPVDLFKVLGEKHLTGRTFCQLQDELLCEKGLWILDCGHMYIVIREQTLLRIRKLSESRLSEFRANAE